MSRSVDTDGIIVIDKNGDILFKSGLADHSDVQRELVVLHSNQLGSIDKRLCAINVGTMRLTVLTLRLEVCSAYVLHDSRDARTLFDFILSVDIAYNILQHLVSSLTVVDADAKLRFISPVSATSLGLAPGEGIGQAVTDVIKGSRLHEVLRTGKPEVGQLMAQGKTRIVSRRPIMEGDRIIGAIGQLLFKAPEQLHELSREVARLKSEVDFYQRELSVIRSKSYGLEQIIGNSEAIRELKSNIARIAPLDVSVLLIGESGTGKELVANAIHSLSDRRNRSLVVVNSAALPSDLVESEMFGYEPGAFTGAERKGRKGKFELADKTTLFLDEIGDMPLGMQVKLLRVLQDRMFERIGSERPRYSDFRLISASNRDLKQMVNSEKFRLDLYYRISSVVLRIPPLRDRTEDIPALVDNFLEAYSRRHQTRLKRLQKNVYAYLCEQQWPGNIRQLLHEVEKAAIFSDSDELKISDFYTAPHENSEKRHLSATRNHGTISASVNNVELRLIREAMVRHKGNKSRVANELGISRSYLYKKLTALQNETP